jgi:hypothetical protein
VIPSSDTYATLEPSGTGPLLDPLFSTEAVEIEHDSVAPSRAAKIAWLSAHRPDVLRWLKVCFFVNDPGNCGECGKCLLTMVELAVAGALAQAALFPPAIDLDAVRRMRVRTRKARIDWLEALGLVEAGGGPDELAGAIREALDRGTRDFQAELVAGRAPLRSFRSGAVNSYLELLHDPPSAPELHDAIGLVRSVDAGRHTYTAGALGSGRLAGELGSLHAHAGEIPVWITDDGRVVTRDYSPIVEPPAVGSVTRWLLAPLGWRRFPQRAARLAAVPRRALALRRRLPRCAAPGGEPVGFIHDDAGENRLPLYSAVHPITGDQLLSTCRWEPIDLGYADVTQLGYLDPHAPITGRAGTINPRLTWASRFGQVVRQA